MKTIEVPALPNNVFKSYSEALAAPLATISLARSVAYGHLVNTCYQQLSYEAELYQNSQHFSSVFLRHMELVADQIARRFDRGKRVLEVGCGKGIFLEMLEERGFSDLAGYDVTYEGDSNKVVKRYFSEADSNYNADLIVLRHTLEQVPRPLEFLKELVSINGNPQAKFLIETPCADWKIRQQAWWDFTNEYCSFFGEGFFRRVFPTCDVSHVFSGQYLLVIADGSELAAREESDEYLEVHFDSLFKSFGGIEPADSPNPLRNYSAGLLVGGDTNSMPCRDDDGRYWIWGCATKGVLYLWHQKLLSPSFHSPVGCIDVSVAKQGKYLPCLGFRVDSPAFFKRHARDGDRVVVMNPNYLGEVRDYILGSCSAVCEVIGVGSM